MYVHQLPKECLYTSEQHRTIDCGMFLLVNGTIPICLTKTSIDFSGGCKVEPLVSWKNNVALWWTTDSSHTALCETQWFKKSILPVKQWSFSRMSVHPSVLPSFLRPCRLVSDGVYGLHQRVGCLTRAGGRRGTNCCVWFIPGWDQAGTQAAVVLWEQLLRPIFT